MIEVFNLFAYYCKRSNASFIFKFVFIFKFCSKYRIKNTTFKTTITLRRIILYTHIYIREIFNSVLYLINSTVLYNIILYSIVLYKYCTVQYSIVLSSIELCLNINNWNFLSC